MHKTRRILDWYDEVDIKRHDDEVSCLRLQVRGLAVAAFLNGVMTLLLVLSLKGWL